MEATYSLDDPRKNAKEAPYTFFLPSQERLNAIEPGDTVKLMFRPIPPDRKYEIERMWVIVDEIDNDDMSGRLDNQPFDMPQIKAGDTVSFQRHNIIEIQWANKTKGTEFPISQKEYYDRCMVDTCVLEDDVPVHYIYREKPDLDQEGDKYPDSGWRIRGDYRGLSDDEIDKRDVSYVALGAVLNRDDSWFHLIDEPPGSAFTRNFETGEFEIDE